jgi:hypothetical protein
MERSTEEGIHGWHKITFRIRALTVSLPWGEQNKQAALADLCTSSRPLALAPPDDHSCPSALCGESVLKNPLREIRTVGSMRGEVRQGRCRASSTRSEGKRGLSMPQEARPSVFAHRCCRQAAERLSSNSIERKESIDLQPGIPLIFVASKVLEGLIQCSTSYRGGFVIRNGRRPPPANLVRDYFG